MRLFFVVLLSCALLILSGSIYSSVKAQTNSPLNLTISPVNVVFETNPGETQTATVKIRNNAPQTETLQIKVGSFTADADGGNPQLLEVDPQSEFLQWLTLSESTFSLPSNEWKSIDLTFTPPNQAALSYYYALYIERPGNPTAQPGETQVEGSAAVLVLTTVTSPNARRELQLEAMTVKKPWVEFLPQEIKLNIKNTGNIHVAPTGNIFIDGHGQKDLAVLSINPTHSMILPGTTRTFSVVWDQGFPRWNAEDLQWDWSSGQLNNFRFGDYTAHAVLVYDNGERDVPIESYLHFWVIPWRIVLLAMAIPLLPSLLVFGVMKWRYRRA